MGSTQTQFGESKAIRGSSASNLNVASGKFYTEKELWRTERGICIMSLDLDQRALTSWVAANSGRLPKDREKGGRIFLERERERERERDSIRGLPYMTSANFFWPLPPWHCHKSADCVPFACFLGTHCGRHILKPPKGDVVVYKFTRFSSASSLSCKCHARQGVAWVRHSSRLCWESLSI